MDGSTFPTPCPGPTAPPQLACHVGAEQQALFFGSTSSVQLCARGRIPTTKRSAATCVLLSWRLIMHFDDHG